MAIIRHIKTAFAWVRPGKKARSRASASALAAVSAAAAASASRRFRSPSIKLRTAIDVCRTQYKTRQTLDGETTYAMPFAPSRIRRLLGIPEAKAADVRNQVLRGVWVGVTAPPFPEVLPKFRFSASHGRPRHVEYGHWRINESLSKAQKAELLDEENNFLVDRAHQLRSEETIHQLQMLGARVVKYAHGTKLNPLQTFSSLIVSCPAPMGEAWDMPAVELVPYRDLKQWIRTEIARESSQSVRQPKGFRRRMTKQ